MEGEFLSDTRPYVHELQTGQTEWVSRGPTYGTSGGSYQPALSADGRYVVFGSQSALVEDDTELRPHVYLLDRATATTSRVSVDSDGGQGDLGSRGSEAPAISADGRYVAFSSDARDLAPGVDRFDAQIYVRDRSAETTTLASVNADGDEAVGDDTLGPSISADGRYVAFHTRANNLYPGHVFDTIDVVVRDMLEAKTKAITVGRASGDYSLFASLSADGQSVTCGSLASFLVGDDTNGAIDVFRRALTGADENPPALTLPDTLDVPATAPDGAAVEYTVDAEDDTDPAPSIDCSPTSGSTSPDRRHDRRVHGRPTRAATNRPRRSASMCREPASRSTTSGTCSSCSATSPRACGKASTPNSRAPRRRSAAATQPAHAPT